MTNAKSVGRIKSKAVFARIVYVNLPFREGELGCFFESSIFDRRFRAVGNGGQLRHRQNGPPGLKRSYILPWQIADGDAGY